MVWALIPAFTLGLGTCVAFGWAAVRLRSRLFAVLTGVSLAVAVIALILAGGQKGANGGSSTAGGLLFLLILGGLIGTFAVRGRMVGKRRRGSGSPALAAALARRERRRDARELLSRDPGLARELRIGRPDLHGTYDDGGLVDVNHVPPRVLATLPGMTPALAIQIAQARDTSSGFESPTEMSIYADLPDGLADELADHLLFLRY